MDTINYFIAETDLPQQDNTQSYGIIDSSSYRVTSLFSSSNNPLAYAVTTGEIFLVEQTNNTNLLNLFLIPENLNFGIPVAYFVYRGLLKSDFLTVSNGNITIRPTDSNDSDLIKNLRKARNPEVALSLYSDVADDVLIESMFDNEDYQFARVSQGDSIGRFDNQQDYGFEIMLAETFFSPDLETARTDINIIAISGDVNEAESARLQILNYIDPAAYFGLFAHPDYSVGTNNPSSPSTRKTEGIYEFVQKFITKNKIYIDVRDIYENPLDWFTDSPTAIKITTDGSSALTSSEVNYRGMNQFPINSNANDFSNSQFNMTGQQYYVMTLSLPVSNLTTPLLALHSGYWKKFADRVLENMVFSICTDNSGWSDDKSFAFFSVEDSAARVPIASYLRLQLSEYVTMDVINNQLTEDDTLSSLQTNSFPFI